jgi:hypothetical protein
MRYLRFVQLRGVQSVRHKERNVMRRLGLFAVSLFITLGLLQLTPAYGQFGDFLKSVKKVIGIGGELSEDKIVEGLKEALQVGTSTAVEIVSKVDGYYENPKIRIPAPGAIQKVEKLLRAAGFGAQLDAFEMSMNRAAEKAAPEAKDIFWDAIKQMSVSDARKILEGRDDEATLYFKDRTYDRLSEIFKPIVHKTMSDVEVTRKFQELDEKVHGMPFVGSLSLDLDQYVADGALEGLCSMLAEEEKKIRQDPAARVTDLLKEVFGSSSDGK